MVAAQRGSHDLSQPSLSGSSVRSPLNSRAATGEVENPPGLLRNGLWAGNPGVVNGRCAEARMAVPNLLRANGLVGFQGQAPPLPGERSWEEHAVTRSMWRLWRRVDPSCQRRPVEWEGGARNPVLRTAGRHFPWWFLENALRSSSRTCRVASFSSHDH